MRLAAILSGLTLTAGLLLAAGTAQAADKPSCGLNNGKPATGTPIEIGAVVGKTGPADFSAPAMAAQAYFKCVNANGGINGRPVHYTIADDGWNPEQAAQVAAKLVKDQKVVALVGNSSFVECAANSKFYETENVLVIAGVGVPRDCFHSKNIAPTNAGPRNSNVVGAAWLAQTTKAKRLVCIGPTIPGVGDWSCDGVAEWGKANGLEVKTILIDPGSMDTTSVILQAASFNPDIIDVNLPKEPAVPLFAAAEQQDMGAKYKWMGPTSLYNADFPKAIGKYWDGKVYVELELEPLDKPSPDVKNWHAILDTYATPSDQRDTFSQAGYLAAEIATATLLKMDPAKIDRASVTEAFRNIKGFHSDVSCGAWYFGPGDEHAPTHAGSVALIENGAFVTKASCQQVTDPDLASVYKLEKDQHLAD